MGGSPQPWVLVCLSMNWGHLWVIFFRRLNWGFPAERHCWAPLDLWKSEGGLWQTSPRFPNPRGAVHPCWKWVYSISRTSWLFLNRNRVIPIPWHQVRKTLIEKSFAYFKSRLSNDLFPVSRDSTGVPATGAPRGWPLLELTGLAHEQLPAISLVRLSTHFSWPCGCGCNKSTR